MFFLTVWGCANAKLLYDFLLYNNIVTKTMVNEWVELQK